jgi:uncharacterized Zn finger protein
MHECEICGNTFETELLKEGEGYDDFGYRYCPFCGTQYDMVNTDEKPLTQTPNNEA